MIDYNLLPSAAKEEIEEKAGIFEFDAGMDRNKALDLAYELYMGRVNYEMQHLLNW